MQWWEERSLPAWLCSNICSGGKSAICSGGKSALCSGGKGAICSCGKSALTGLALLEYLGKQTIRQR